MDWSQLSWFENKPAVNPNDNPIDISVSRKHSFVQNVSIHDHVIPDRTSILISGYIRNVQQLLCKNIPYELKKLCLLYFKCKISITVDVFYKSRPVRHIFNLYNGNNIRDLMALIANICCTVRHLIQCQILQ